MIAIVAVLGVATLALLVAWGLRVIHDIEELENLSSRTLGFAGEIRRDWLSSAGNDHHVAAARNVRLHPAGSSVAAKAAS